ncbi:hypothetical protein MTO96_039214 [Rhipicephalus appendiculatus]
MATMRCIFVAFYITCGVLLHVYAWDNGNWDCVHLTADGQSTQHVSLVPEEDGTPCTYGYCFRGMCVAQDNNQHLLKRRKRSLRSFVRGFAAGRRVGLRQARRRSSLWRFGRR